MYKLQQGLKSPFGVFLCVYLAMKKLRFTGFVLVLTLSAQLSFGQELSENLEQLVEWMSGEFDSSEQAEQNSDFLNISLKMTRIWHEKPNGAWVYIEQARADQPEKPYRQRIYFISELTEDEYSSDVYTLPNEEKYVGAWKDVSLLNELTPFDLVNKSGCTVIIFFDGFQYGGGTSKGTCKSELNGASYATSEVTILEDAMQSWDRGYNSEDVQVWGSTAGAYIFKKRR